MIFIKTLEEIKIMRDGGRILAEILSKLASSVKPGIATLELEQLARELVSFYKVKPAFLGFESYPAVLCISINEEVVHSLPSERKITEGDLVSIDMGIIFNGFNLDSAVTVVALDSQNHKEWASLHPRENNLLNTTKEALNLGMSKIKAGRKTGEISNAIEQLVNANGFFVVKELTGHGIGRSLHEEPQIPNFGSKNSGVEMKEGMVLAIEPIVSMGDWRITKSNDDFAYVTRDGSRSAHFEHTVAVTEGGPLVLTKK